jgi:hypothetical protein
VQVTEALLPVMLFSDFSFWMHPFKLESNGKMSIQESDWLVYVGAV